MKSLKLDHITAQEVLKGVRTSTWRLNDDKDLHVNDVVSLIDKQDPNNPASWRSIGSAIITTIFEKQLGKVDKSDMDGQQKYASLEEVFKEYRGYYGPQVGAETPVKIIRFSFTPQSAIEADKPISKAVLYCDGGSRGNPGPSASGFVLYDGASQIIAENGLFLGVTTNNQAEYQSLKLGMEEALKRGVTELDVHMDSLLVVNQMNGSFKVKNRDLVEINKSVKELAGKFSRVRISHVPRERNRRADAMVNKVLDSVKS